MFAFTWWATFLLQDNFTSGRLTHILVTSQVVTLTESAITSCQNPLTAQPLVHRNITPNAIFLLTRGLQDNLISYMMQSALHLPAEHKKLTS